MIETPNDSKLQTIDKHAITHSAIKSIRIQSKLVEIKEKYHYTKNLTKKEVSPSNQQYCFIDDKMIIVVNLEN